MAKIMDVNLNYQDFKDFKLSFDTGKFYLIVGDNHSGKTKLLNILSSIELTNDMVMCDNVLLDSTNQNEYLENIGVVKRVSNLSFKYVNVLDELLYPLMNLSYSRKKAMERINYLLELFEFQDNLDKKISDLSVNDKQELLLIISLLHFPNVLLLDNVLSVFNLSQRNKIINCLKKLMFDADLTVISFASSLDDYLSSDRIILLSNYQVIKDITYRELFLCDQDFYSHNIAIPFMIDLSVKLKVYGVINKDYVNMKELVDDIWG